MKSTTARIDKNLMTQFERIQDIVYKTNGEELNIRKASKLVAKMIRSIDDDKMGNFFKNFDIDMI